MPLFPANNSQDWLHANYPAKLTKRWQQVRANEELRRAARLDKTYGQIHNNQHHLIRAPNLKVGEKAEEFYQSRIGRKHDPLVGTKLHQHPYDRMLVEIKPTYEDTLYCPANWVRTKYDGQWWIVTQKPVNHANTGRPNSNSQNNALADYNSRVYSFLHLFVPQDELSAHHKTIDPAPRVWVSVECTNSVWDNSPLPRVVNPPASHPLLPQLQTRIVTSKEHMVEYKGLTRISYLQTEIEITATHPNGGRTQTVRVTRLQYRGEWPVRGTSIGGDNRVMDKAMTLDLVDFLCKVDRLCRGNRAPIIIERTDNKVRECEGSLMLALSLLRASNFQRKGKFDTPLQGGTMLQNKLEVARSQVSPLESKLRANYRKGDKVLTEAHYVLDQCAGIMGFEKAEGAGKSALGLVYEILIREEERMRNEAKGVPQKPGPARTIRTAMI